MKKSPLLFALVFYFIPLVSKAQTNAITAKAKEKQKTCTNCLDLESAALGNLTFTVNELQDKRNGKADVTVYPIRYRVKIYRNHILEKVFHLGKKKNDTVSIKITVADTAKYCVQIRKHIFARIFFKKIEWTSQHIVTAGLTPSNPGVYYVSTSKKFLPPARTITSTDGTSGDGVKVLVE